MVIRVSGAILIAPLTARFSLFRDAGEGTIVPRSAAGSGGAATPE